MSIRNERVLLKLTGEMFGIDGKGIDFERVARVADIVASTQEQTGAKLVCVTGGGNMFRGKQKEDWVGPNYADYVGMAGTVMNAAALAHGLRERSKLRVELFGALDCGDLMRQFEMSKYDKNNDRQNLDNWDIVVIGGGTGHPGCTSDTAAAEYARNFGCGLLIKFSTTDGVYDRDPRQDKEARLFKIVDCSEVLERSLGVMDRVAFEVCQEEGIDIFVCHERQIERLPEIIANVAELDFGTLVTREGVMV